jgi:uncharacterized repeat protein (TIGR01451 family)
LGLLAATLSARAAPGTPPVALHPPRNAVTATLTTTVSVTYDDPIDPSTVTSHTFAVHGMQSGLVTATHTVVEGNTILVTPTRPFHQGELVYAIATTHTLNITGTGPISATQWQFNAGAIHDRCVGGFSEVHPGSLTHLANGDAAWGDYDNDGDLDILLTGWNGSTAVAEIYENRGSGFSEAYLGSLTDVYWSSVDWGDYDNDGDLDILLTGYDSGDNRTSRIYQNTGSGFTEEYAGSLTGVSSGSVAWGDYDNDGDLDILLTGNITGDTIAKIYENTGSGFSEVYPGSLTGVWSGSVAWGDYDNDGDLDILLTGYTGSAFVTNIYQNRGSSGFSEVYTGTLPGVSNSSVAWGDYDNDGDLDILLTGWGGAGAVARIYQNTGSGFSEAYPGSLDAVWGGSVAWGDYDNDGDLDILLTGHGSSRRIAKIYQNTGSGFREVHSGDLQGVGYSSAAWGDYDGDDDLDILLTGHDGTNSHANIYRNEECRVDLALAKSADPDPAVAGTGLTYTLVITNQGNVSTTNAVVSDTLPPSATLQTLDQTDNHGDEFNSGIHDNTHWLDPFPERWGEERLTLFDTLQASGVFTSRVFDAGNVVPWETLAWRPRRPVGKPLPDNGAAETAYALGDVNMVGNRLLLHLDDAGAPFADSSGHGNDGTCTPPACPTPGVTGRFNDALAFDGNDAVTVDDALDPTRYALELWIYPETVTNTSLILRTDAVSGTQHHYSHLLGIRDGRFLHLSRAGGTEHAITGTTVISPDTWYHVVGTAESGGELKLYVNGREEARAAGLDALWEGGDRYVLGASYGISGTQPFHGRLDEVAVYSRTLSAAEVSDHYLRGALDLEFEVRTCHQSDCSDGIWHGPYSEESNGALDLPAVTFSPPLTDARYAQYRATLTTGDPAYAPALRRVTLGPDHYDVTVAPSGSCVALPEAFTCSLGTLDAGGVATVVARTHLHPSALGPITNTAQVTTTDEVSPTNNTVTVTTWVTSEVRLQVAKYDDDRDLPYWHEETYGMADPVNPGRPLTYTLLVHNHGPSTAWSVVVSDSLPITPLGVLAPEGWNCTTAEQTVACTITALSPWHWEALLLTGIAPAENGIITNSAEITTTGSSVRLNSLLTDTLTTTIMPLSDLVIAKEAAPDPVDPGATITFTLQVTNTGPYTATGIVLTDTLAPGLIGYPIAGPEWSTCSGPDEQIVCSLAGALLPGDSASVQITATAPLTGLLQNHALVTSAIFDPHPESNETQLYAAVRPVADLSIAKQDEPDPVEFGAPLTYTLTISNAGPATAGALTTTVSARTHRNIRIPIGGTAWPYPNTLWLNSIPGLVREITVTLYGLEHTYPADLVALLTGPNGRSTVLMANAGGGTDAEALTLTFHEAGAPLPFSDPLTSTTTYRPTNHGFGESLPNPAPAAPYDGGFSPFYGHSPNGAWRLYVYDTFDSDGGEITGGWELEIVAVTTDTVTMIDTLPATLPTPTLHHQGGWSCTLGAELLCETTRLNVGETLTWTLTSTAPIAHGTITNSAIITSTLFDSQPANNRATITTTVVAPPDYYRLYLPLVVRNYVTAPDLVVEDLQAMPDQITVVVKNVGAAPVEEGFWVDVYVDPDPVPTSVNQTWPYLSNQGMVWGVTDGLAMGEALTLTLESSYYRPDESTVTWPLTVGTPVYAQVDSAHSDTPYGGVMENHEILGGAYNNIRGTEVR